MKLFFNIEFDFNNVVAQSCLNHISLFNLSCSCRCTSHNKIVRFEGHVFGDERNELGHIVPQVPGVALLLYYPIHAAPNIQIVTVGDFVFSYETRYGIGRVETLAQAPWVAFSTCASL